MIFDSLFGGESLGDQLPPTRGMLFSFFMEDQCDMSSVSHKKPKILRAVKRDSCQEQKTSGALVISIDFGESKLEISAPRWDEGPLGGMMAHIGEK